MAIVPVSPPASPIPVQCGCVHGRSIPVWATLDGRAAIHALFGAAVYEVGQLPFLTYRCPRCRSITTVSLMEFLGITS